MEDLLPEVFYIKSINIQNTHIMKTRKVKLKYIFVALITIFTFCCSDGEDGAIGPAGPQGEQGIVGSNGTNGSDGQDGNANVRSFTYDLSIFSGLFHSQSVPELTQDVINNDVILGYLKATGSVNPLFPIPNNNIFLTSSNIDIRVFITPQSYEIDFYEVNSNSAFNVSEGELEELRLIIIEATNKSSKHDIVSKLKSDGVDITNYKATMNYLSQENTF